jgi:hypothetical protein
MLIYVPGKGIMVMESSSNVCVCFDNTLTPIQGTLLRETATGFWFSGKEILAKFKVQGSAPPSPDAPKAIEVFVPASRITYILTLKD